MSTEAPDEPGPGADAPTDDDAAAPPGVNPPATGGGTPAHPDGGTGASALSHDRAPHMPRWIVLGLVGASVLVLWPFWTWIVLAVWVGHLGRKRIRALTHWTGGRQRAAAILTAALLALLVVPVGLVVWTLLIDAIDLAKRLLASQQGKAFFEQLVTPSSTPEAAKEQQPFDLVMQHGSKAWEILGVVFAMAAEVMLGLFVFLSGTYTVLVDGPGAYRWLEQNLPIDPLATRRFAAAFTETGRGLFVGVGGAGLAQAVVATIAYLVIGVPEPFVLGLLTLLASVLPSVGTALVWVPVAIGLAITGRTEAAIGLAIVGVAVIGAIDNLVRPILARRAQLALPSYLIMVGMFGGIALVGAAGVILGPLVLRLAKEALVMAREERVADAPP